MKQFIYHAPTEIVFGEGAEQKLVPELQKYGGTRVFLVYGGQSAQKSGLLDRIVAACEEAGIAIRTAGGVVPNPRVSTARRMVRDAIEFGADLILAVGGGSVIDTAKAVAHGTANPDIDIWEFWSRRVKLEKSMPVAAVLTLSAAGSETSDSAVLTNDTLEPPTKRGLGTELNRCRFAIMDPKLTCTLPVYQIGAGAADIFMHTAERYFGTVYGNHLTDRIAEGLFKDIIAFGPKGVLDPNDMEAMSEIMWCGSISHVGITGLGAGGTSGKDGDWACHQLGHALSSLTDATHGASLTAVWGAWARYVYRENTARFAQFARNVYGVTEEDDEQAALQGIFRTEAFFFSLGMPLSLTELLRRMPTEEELAAFAESCSYGRTRTVGAFKVLDYNAMLDIFRMAV